MQLLKSIALGVLLVCSQAATGQELLTLDEALMLGMQNNLDIKLAENDYHVAEQNNTTGNAGMLPVVSVTSTLNGSTTSGEQVFTTSPEPRTFDNAQNNSFDLRPTLSWRLFDGRRMFIAKDRLKLIVEDSDLDVNTMVQQVVADIMKAYYLVVLEQEKLAVAENTLIYSEERLRVATDKFNVGRAAKLEMLSAQVDFNEDRTALSRQKQALTVARVRLNNLLARDAGTSFVAADSIMISDLLGLESLKEEALTKNLSLRGVENTELISQLELSERKAERWPTIDANLGYSYNSREAGSGIFVSSNEAGVNYGLTFSWSLFNGWNQQRLIALAELSQNRSTVEKQQVVNNLMASISETYALYETNYELITLEQENLDVAVENASIARERYQVGRSSALEFREAQINAAEAEIRLLEATYNTRVAEIDLTQLSGSIATL